MNTKDVRGTLCDREGDIVAYLYAEATPEQRTEFESHMLECTACTDEFAELSGARYSVYEWQREEFAPLATPSFAIPYKTPARSRFADGLRSLISFGWPAYAMAAVVLAFTLAGIGYWNMKPATDLRADTSNVATGNTVATAINKTETKSAREPIAEEVTKPVIDQVAVRSTPATAVKISVTNRPSKPRAAKPSVRNVVRSAEVAVDIKPISLMPSLTAAVEDEDTSLRLTDIFDSVDREL